MGTNIQTFCNFLTTSDVMKILGIGNKTCLELFHRKDFPCVKVGRAFKISEENFREYFKTRRVYNETICADCKNNKNKNIDKEKQYELFKGCDKFYISKTCKAVLTIGRDHAQFPLG